MAFGLPTYTDRPNRDDMPTAGTRPPRRSTNEESKTIHTEKFYEFFERKLNEVQSEKNFHRVLITLGVVAGIAIVFYLIIK